MLFMLSTSPGGIFLERGAPVNQGLDNENESGYEGYLVESRETISDREGEKGGVQAVTKDTGALHRSLLMIEF